MSRGDTPFWKTFLLEMATKSPTFKKMLIELEINPIYFNPSPSEDTVEKKVTSRKSDDETKKEEVLTKVVDVINVGKKRKSEDDEESVKKRRKEETQIEKDSDQTVQEDPEQIEPVNPVEATLDKVEVKSKKVPQEYSVYSLNKTKFEAEVNCS
jgi:hypothetical protein